MTFQYTFSLYLFTMNKFIIFISLLCLSNGKFMHTSSGLQLQFRLLIFFFSCKWKISRKNVMFNLPRNEHELSMNWVRQFLFFSFYVFLLLFILYFSIFFSFSHCVQAATYFRWLHHVFLISLLPCALYNWRKSTLEHAHMRTRPVDVIEWATKEKISRLFHHRHKAQLHAFDASGIHSCCLCKFQSIPNNLMNENCIFANSVSSNNEPIKIISNRITFWHFNFESFVVFHLVVCLHESDLLMSLFG